ncbi:MAG: hypothetical protein H6R26_83 [Proteobacteria bacterium]|nr:hypothetical protein [Pseudomonadota bacterium]
MGFTLDRIVPWGRTFDEYRAMFGLSDGELVRRILGCGDGPASFNAELTRRGGSVVSFDPVYAFDAGQIRNRIAETYETVMDQMRRNKDDYVWTSVASVEELGRIRMAAMDRFLADYETGKKEGRYVSGELPVLPFENGSFGLALSSHFLFLYSDHLPQDFHIRSIEEMLRVADEVRIFPVLTLDGRKSPYLDGVTDALARSGYAVRLLRVPYEFQRGGNEVMVVRRA